MNQSSPMDPCHQFNGDIAGSGVRVSFYVQNFILVLLVDRSDRSDKSRADPENALWTFIATSFGLTVAALVQVPSGGLTFLEGILVAQLAWFANIGTFLALASYSRSKGEDTVVKVAAVLQGYFSMILTIFMWVYADRFPSRDCQLKFVFLFGCKLPALGSGRIVALVFASLTILVYTGVTSYECWGWWQHKGSRIHSQDGQRRPRGKRTEWLKTSMNPIFFGIMLSQAIVLTYFISTTELIIHSNNATSDPPNVSGFGQVLALTVLIPSLISLYRAIRPNPDRKSSEQRRDEENMQTQEDFFPQNRKSSLRAPSMSLGPISPGTTVESSSSVGLPRTAADGCSSMP